jgi:hypothetical protein
VCATGVYILKNTSRPRGGILADVIWEKNMKKGKRKRSQMLKKKEETGKKGSKGKAIVK